MTWPSPRDTLAFLVFTTLLFLAATAAMFWYGVKGAVVEFGERRR